MIATGGHFACYPGGGLRGEGRGGGGKRQVLTGHGQGLQGKKVPLTVIVTVTDTCYC